MHTMGLKCHFNNADTHDVQDNIHNVSALGALLALMYLDQDGNIVCDQSIYAAIRRSEDDFSLPMGDPAITNNYMGLVYDIDRNGLEDGAYPAVRIPRNIESEYIHAYIENWCTSCLINYNYIECEKFSSNREFCKLVVLLQIKEHEYH